MASLEKRPHGFRVVFMFRGEKHARSLQTKDPKQAKSTLARMEDTLRRIELGTLQVPDGADIATFLLSDGILAAKPRNEKPITLTQIFDEYFANLPAGANEATTIDGMRLHQRHLERLLGAEFHVQRLTVSDLQGFIEKRSKEKGIRGNVTATTIKKALVTFRTIWRWGMMTDRLRRRLANADLVRRIARMTAWTPLTPMEDFRSASVLLRSTSAAIQRLAPDRLRTLFHDRRIALTSYAGGIVRLAMPNVPLTTHEAGMLIQALALVQPQASGRQSVEALSA